MLKKKSFFIYSKVTIADQHQHQTNLNFAKNNCFKRLNQNNIKQKAFIAISQAVVFVCFLADRKLQG